MRIRVADCGLALSTEVSCEISEDPTTNKQSLTSNGTSFRVQCDGEWFHHPNSADTHRRSCEMASTGTDATQKSWSPLPRGAVPDLYLVRPKDI